MKILVVDDDKDIRKIIRIYLEQQGYEIIEAEDGNDALEKVGEETDLVILDVMMPNLDGIETCKLIREKYQMPILFLTAKNTDLDKVEGFSVGADDYISKPFTPLELIARVKSNLRRYHEYGQDPRSAKSGVITIDNLVIDQEAFACKKDGVQTNLTRTEFAILALLASNRGKVFSLEEIFHRVWGESSYLTTESTVSVHIKKLREKIEDDIKKPRFVKTVWGVGYRVD